MASSFSMNQHGLATIQFEDATGAPVAGPMDSVNTTTPIAPTCSSDTPAVATAGPTVAGAQPGQFTCQFTPVAVGSFNALIQPLVNSDGSSVLETEGPNVGTAFATPTPIPVTVTAGAAEELGFSVATTA